MQFAFFFFFFTASTREIKRNEGFLTALTKSISFLTRMLHVIFGIRKKDPYTQCVASPQPKALRDDHAASVWRTTNLVSFVPKWLTSIATLSVKMIDTSLTGWMLMLLLLKITYLASSSPLWWLRHNRCIIAQFGSR